MLMFEIAGGVLIAAGALAFAAGVSSAIDTVAQRGKSRAAAEAWAAERKREIRRLLTMDIGLLASEANAAERREAERREAEDWREDGRPRSPKRQLLAVDALHFRGGPQPWMNAATWRAMLLLYSQFATIQAELDDEAKRREAWRRRALIVASLARRAVGR